MRQISRLFVIVASLLIASCSGRPVAPTAGGDSVFPQVIQTGQSPTNWMLFYPSIGPGLGEIVAYSSNTFWYAMEGGNPQLCKIDMRGQSTCFSTVGAFVSALTVGPDKNIWFADQGSQFLGRMGTNGGLTFFPIPGRGQAIVTGPDGNVWVTLYDPNGVHNGVVKLSAFGVVLAEYDLADQTVHPREIAVGPDGNIWLTGWQDGGLPGAVISVTTSGVMSSYVDPVAGGQPFGITRGPDGNLWITESTGTAGGPNIDEVGKVTTSGTFTFYNVPIPGGLPSDPTHITSGPGGMVWFIDNANAGGSWVFSVSRTGQFVAHSTPDGGGLNGIAPGGDGNLWTTQNLSAGEGRIAVFIRRIITVTPSSLSMTIGDMSSLSVSETNYSGKWTASSSDTRVATVVKGGSASTFTVTAVKAGYCTIVVSDKTGNSFPVSVVVH
jgi:streptogramin lyase